MLRVACVRENGSVSDVSTTCTLRLQLSFLTVVSALPPVLQVALVYGQMNEPPGARARVALTGLSVAEYFRDQEGQDVLLFIDNIFRFTQAGSEVGPL